MPVRDRAQAGVVSDRFLAIAMTERDLFNE